MSARRSGRRYCKPSEHAWGPNPVHLFGVCTTCGEIRQEPAPEQLDTVRHEPDLRDVVYPRWDTDLPGAPRDPEMRALARIVAELQRVDPAARGRILRYLGQRYEPVRTGGVVINNPLTPR